MTCVALLLILLVLVGFIHGDVAEFEESKPPSSLQRPYRVRWYTEESALVVSWKHKSGSNGAPLGFYIQLQELIRKDVFGPPDYVRVKGSRAAKVYGLKPNAHYALKVVAFTEDEHKSSHSIHVKTKGLAFLEASNLDVSSITDSSAVFTWQHSPDNNVHDVRFELTCRGDQQYTSDGKEVEEEVQFVHHTSATSREKETFLVTELIPNTQYNCYIQTVAGEDQASTPHDDLTFKTEPGTPTRPPTPHVITPHGNDKNVQVDLFETDNQYGPISHYTVHAVPVYRGPSSPRSAPYTPTFPYSQLLTKSVSSHDSMEDLHPLPFLVGKYQHSALPNKLHFSSPLWRKAFKPSTHYAFVVVAYSKTKNGAELKYTLSEPSNPIFISDNPDNKWMAEHKPALARFLHIIVDTVVTFAIAGLLALAGLMILIYWRRKRKMKWSVVDSTSENSDAEVDSRFMKHSARRSKRKKKFKDKTIDDRPKENLAEWAIKKFQRNPKFDAMVYRSPENIREMEELLQQNTILSPNTNNSPKTDHPPRPPSPARLEEVKQTSNNMEESMPLLLSTAPHPTSPLLRSTQSQSAASTVPSFGPSNQPKRSSVRRYSASSVAAAVVHDEYLRGSYTLPHTPQYQPPTSTINSQHYYKTHKPGTPMPTAATPKVPFPRSQSPLTSPTKSSLLWEHPKPYMKVHDDILMN